MGLLGSSTGATMYLDQWSSPQFIKSVEYPDSLEFIYKQYSMVSHGWNNNRRNTD